MAGALEHDWFPADVPPLPDVLVRVKFTGPSGYTYTPQALYRREVDGAWFLQTRSNQGVSWRPAIGAPSHWRLP